MKRLSVAAAMLPLMFGANTLPAYADDASWGCQVLLCAASQNPSWRGVAYCVPPMTKLINAMKKPHFSWPICKEAKAGKPGYEAFGDCPAGTVVGYSSNENDGRHSEPDQCVQTVDLCRNPGRLSYGQMSGDNGNSCIQQITTPRPRRADPYFFDVPDESGRLERFWFNLDR